MKYLVVIVLAVSAWFYFGQATPETKPGAQSATAALSTPPLPAVEAAPPVRTNALKRPLDRTHAVLEQQKTRVGAGEF